VVTPGEELWVKIIDIDLQRRRISLSIKQAAEGGEVSEEYREAFGEHAYDAEGNYVGPFEFAESEFTPETEAQAAWADYVAEHGPGDETPDGVPAAGAAPTGDAAPTADAVPAAGAPPDSVPPDSVSSDSVPSDSVKSDSAAVDGASAETAPPEPAPEAPPATDPVAGAPAEPGD
jgi:small subunit ribosomal protein S1